MSELGSRHERYLLEGGAKRLLKEKLPVILSNLPIQTPEFRAYLLRVPISNSSR